MNVGDTTTCDHHWQGVFAGRQPATVVSDDRAVAVALYTRAHRVWVLDCGHYVVEPPEES